MAIFIVILIAVIFILYLINASNKQLKYEVVRDGGLIEIFSNLESALSEIDFILYQNKITSLEYHNRINEYSYLKLEVKKTFDTQNPYLMQMTHVLNGNVEKKTIPYIISPNQETEQFSSMLVRMGKEIMGKGSR